MKTIKLILLFGLAGVVTWSCSSTSTSNTWDPALGPYAEATRVAVQADSLMGLAQQIPGFGGLFINDSNQLSIYLTQPDDQKETAEEVLSDSELIKEALSNSSASVSNMDIKQGQYTFIKLDTWEKEINSEVLAMDGVYSGGIDQSRNKLSVGVKNKDVKDKVDNKLAELSIPQDAVVMYQMTRPEYY